MLKNTLKIILLSMVGSLLISFIEAYINEATFYSAAISRLDMIKFSNQFKKKSTDHITTLNEICPTNFEMYLFRKVAYYSKHSNPNYNTWEKIKDTKFAMFPTEFRKINNDTELKLRMKSINEEFSVCNYLIRLPTHTRMIMQIKYSTLQPLHLILGWVLATILLKLGKGTVRFSHKIIPKLIPHWLIRIGYFFRGVYRNLIEHIKNYENKGK